MKEGTLGVISDLYEKDQKNLYFILLENQFDDVDTLNGNIESENIELEDLLLANIPKMEPQVIFPNELPVLYTTDVNEIDALKEEAEKRGYKPIAFDYSTFGCDCTGTHW